MQSPSRKTRRIGTAIATPVAILVAAALIWHTSYAAFSGTTRNSGNNWATGSVALTDDDAGSARFQANNLVPGQTETKCIVVTATATVPGVVKGYAVNPVVSPQGLQDHVFITIHHGTGGSFGSCVSFVDGGTTIPRTSLTALAAYSNYANGAGSWPVTAGTQSRTYQITWEFDTTGLSQTELDALQGSQTGIDLQWELQSN
ncbi:hypothetical protein BH09ACT10_BH09ACT10_04430 [soil metagenome]